MSGTAFNSEYAATLRFTQIGLWPTLEMGFALSLGKLFGVHLNDQNGLRFDQDKSFGAENLRGAFNQIMVLVDVSTEGLLVTGVNWDNGLGWS